MEYGLWISNQNFEFLLVNFFHHDLRKSWKKKQIQIFHFRKIKKKP